VRIVRGLAEQQFYFAEPFAIRPGVQKRLQIADDVGRRRDARRVQQGLVKTPRFGIVAPLENCRGEVISPLPRFLVNRIVAPRRLGGRLRPRRGLRITSRFRADGQEGKQAIRSFLAKAHEGSRERANSVA